MERRYLRASTGAVRIALGRDAAMEPVWLGGGWDVRERSRESEVVAA
jgi:hypothetical protein